MPLFPLFKNISVLNGNLRPKSRVCCPKRISSLFTIQTFGFLCALFLFCMPGFSKAVAQDLREFTHFSLLLPEGWDGEEQTGFISDLPEEYLLTLGKKDAEGEKYLAQISIYLLPNKPGASPQEAAQKLAEAQGDPDEPRKEGLMWSFSGEPRTNVVKGRAKTYVNTDNERMLIIIAQDPQGQGAESIVESLKARNPEAKALLGR